MLFPLKKTEDCLANKKSSVLIVVKIPIRYANRNDKWRLDYMIRISRRDTEVLHTSVVFIYLLSLVFLTDFIF